MGRFSRLPAAAVTDTALSDKTLRVLAAIGIYADETGLAYPSVPTLAKILSISERQVQRHLRILEAAGYVTTERSIRHTRGGWGRNRYYLAYPALTLPAAPAEDNDDQPRGTDPSGRDSKCTTGHGSTNEREVTSRVSPRHERGDIQSVTTGPSFQAVEVTSQGERGDIGGGGEVTPWMSDKQPNENQQPIENQPNGRATDVFDAMFSDLLGGRSANPPESPMVLTTFDREFAAGMLADGGWTREEHDRYLGIIPASSAASEPAEPKLLGKTTELVVEAELVPETPKPAEAVVPEQPRVIPPLPKPFDPSAYHHVVADKITRWCGVGIGEAWAFICDLPDSTVVALCRKAHDGKLRKRDISDALKAAQALRARAAE